MQITAIKVQTALAPPRHDPRTFHMTFSVPFVHIAHITLHLERYAACCLLRFTRINRASRGTYESQRA